MVVFTMASLPASWVAVKLACTALASNLVAEPADHGQDAVGDGPDKGGELGVGGGHGDVLR